VRPAQTFPQNSWYNCSAFAATNSPESAPAGADCANLQDFVSLARAEAPRRVLHWVGPDCAKLPRLRAACDLSAFHRSSWRMLSSKIGTVLTGKQTVVNACTHIDKTGAY